MFVVHDEIVGPQCGLGEQLGSGVGIEQPFAARHVGRAAVSGRKKAVREQLDAFRAVDQAKTEGGELGAIRLHGAIVPSAGGDGF
ncbi:hypothetical protein D9M70_608400 [compost metagenome]